MTYGPAMLACAPTRKGSTWDGHVGTIGHPHQVSEPLNEYGRSAYLLVEYRFRQHGPDVQGLLGQYPLLPGESDGDELLDLLGELPTAAGHGQCPGVAGVWSRAGTVWLWNERICEASASSAMKAGYVSARTLPYSLYQPSLRRLFAVRASEMGRSYTNCSLPIP
jgi:hypothetical protein